MSHITDIWTARSEVNTSMAILPDGCRDLIIKCKDSHSPTWFVSPLFDQSEMVQSQARTSSIGFRLKPGIALNNDKLNHYMRSVKLNIEDQTINTNIEDMLNSVAYLDPSIEEALSCLSSDVNSVMQAASLLGVSSRSLQRLLIKQTERSPSYWLQLARVRKAAKHLTQIVPLADTADLYGFSDQSHMSREFQRWFKTSPTQLINATDLSAQLQVPGYAFD